MIMEDTAAMYYMPQGFMLGIVLGCIIYGAILGLIPLITGIRRE